jgi:hypothetical protein
VETSSDETSIHAITLEIQMSTPLCVAAVLSSLAVFWLVSLDASAASIRVPCEKSATRS